MNDKILNKLNLAIIFLAITFAMDAQGQTHNQDVTWLNCHIDIENPQTKNKQRILIEPFPADKFKHRMFSIGIYVSFENNVGIDNVLPGYKRDYGWGATCSCSDNELKANAVLHHNSAKSRYPAHIIVIYQPPIEETGIAPTTSFSVKNRPNINPEKSLGRSDITIKEIPYESTAMAAIERATLAMKQKEAEEKVKSMATAIQGAKYQAELERLLKLQAEKMRLNGRRQ